MNFLLCLFPVTAYLVLPSPKLTSFKDAKYYPELGGVTFGKAPVAIGIYFPGNILAFPSILHPTNGAYCTDFRVCVGDQIYDFSREQLAGWITNNVQPNKTP